MKFVTEMELRDQYRLAPFTTYRLAPDLRLTPGARQFLTDRRIAISTNLELEAIASCSYSTDRNRLALQAKLDAMSSMFLLTAAELWQAGDTVLASDVLELNKCFQQLRLAEAEQGVLQPLCFKNFNIQQLTAAAQADLGLNLTEIHLALPKGRLLAYLNHLRALLREVGVALTELYWSDEQQCCARADLVAAVDTLVGALIILLQQQLGGNHESGF